MLEDLDAAPVLLPTGLQDADEDTLRSGSGRDAIPAPHLARYHHGPNGLFSAPVGCVQTWAMQKGEQRILFPPQMIRQAPVFIITIVGLQETSHRRFQPAADGGQTARADLLLLVAVPQAQALLQNGLHPQGESSGPRSEHSAHLPAALQQMRQTASQRSSDGFQPQCFHGVVAYCCAELGIAIQDQVLVLRVVREASAIAA